MFDAVELGKKVGKAGYREQVPALRTRLLNLQFDLREREFPLVVLLSGNDRVACNEVLNLMHEWMDPRHVQAAAWAEVTDEERRRPLFWRYWRLMPPRGSIGVFLHAWTAEAIVRRLMKQIDDAGYARLLEHARSLERELVADGASIVKLWFHLPEKRMKRRLESAAAGEEPRMLMTRKESRTLLRRYDRFVELMEDAVRSTSAPEAPWQLIESTDARHRNLAAMRLIEDELTRRLAEKPARPRRVRRKKKAAGVADPLTVLDRVDLAAALGKDKYEKALRRWQKKLGRLARRAHHARLATVLVFEGWDAAGKGGLIRRMTAAMDASFYRVIPIAAPTDEERARHYLWRFWRQLPRDGYFTIFDRSWYGRVMVERVEGFAREEEWKRAYSEINDFEEQICEHGTVLLKFWLHIDPDEQLARFKAREQTPFKQYKITDEDYRNRERWSEYEQAVDEMIARTDGKRAPWHVLAANDKRWARVEGLRILCRSLSRALKQRGK
jgi:polyphosphate:AMP phosphotransferase